MGRSKDGCNWVALILTGILSVNATPLILKKGSNALLPCPLVGQDRTSSQCYWTRDGQYVNMTQQCGDHLDWENIVDEKDCSLRILDARADLHEGEWLCVLKDSILPYKPIAVIVREPHVLKLAISRRTGYLARTNDGRVAVTAGTQITANCSTNGLRPDDKLQWTKVMTTWKNHSLALREEREPGHHYGTEDVQVLTCPVMTEMDNKAQLVCSVIDGKNNEVFRKEVQIEVFFGPQYTAERSSYLAHPHMQVSLHCPLHSNPGAAYKWFFLARNGLWIEIEGQKHRTLQLEKVSVDQAGFYNCTATNSFLGQAYTASELLYLNVVKGESFRPNKVVCTMRGRIREHVTLLCPTPVSPFTRTRWFFQGDDRRWVPVPSDGHALTMFNVNAGQAGLYKCVPAEGKAKDGCGFIYLSLGRERLFDNLQNFLGVAFIAVGACLFVGLLAFVIQITKIKAVLRVQERDAQMMDGQPPVWTSDKVMLPYYSLPPAYSPPEHPIPPPHNAI